MLYIGTVYCIYSVSPYFSNILKYEVHHIADQTVSAMQMHNM